MFSWVDNWRVSGWVKLGWKEIVKQVMICTSKCFLLSPVCARLHQPNMEGALPNTDIRRCSHPALVLHRVCFHYWRIYRSINWRDVVCEAGKVWETRNTLSAWAKPFSQHIPVILSFQKRDTAGQQCICIDGCSAAGSELPHRIIWITHHRTSFHWNKCG